MPPGLDYVDRKRDKDTQVASPMTHQERNAKPKTANATTVDKYRPGLSSTMLKQGKLAVEGCTGS